MPARSRSQSHLRYPLTSILGSAGGVRVLRSLVSIGSPASAPALGRLAGLTPQGTRLVLDSLVAQAMVNAHGTGRARLYSINLDHPFAGPVVDLFREEQRRWDDMLDFIRQVLGRQGSAVSSAWLYGSVARGEDSPGSDLDLAIIVRSPAVADKIREALMPLEDAQQMRISLTALTPADLLALPEDDTWWTNIVREGRVLKGRAPEQMRQHLARAAA